MKAFILEASINLCHLLEQKLLAQGFDVQFTDHVDHGLKYLSQERFDVIVLDLNPKFNALQLLRVVQEKQTNPIVILLSEMEELQGRVKGLYMGADDYLCKPFSFEELITRINTLLGKRQWLHSQMLRIEPVVIDMPLKRVLLEGDELRLTRNEYMIMEMLCLNVGKVMSYESLRQYMYRDSSAQTQNAIEAHISSLRKKLKSHGVNNFIKTRRSFGYYVEDVSVLTNLQPNLSFV